MAFFHSLQIPNKERLVKEDEDPIVDDNEIDTGKSLDGGVTIPRTYRSVLLKKWQPAPVVREARGKPGEMGKK